MSTATQEIIDRDRDGLIYDGTKYERPANPAALTLARIRHDLSESLNRLAQGDAAQQANDVRMHDLKTASKEIDKAARSAIAGQNLVDYEFQRALRLEHEKLGLQPIEAEIAEVARRGRLWSQERSQLQWRILGLEERRKMAELANNPNFQAWFGDSVTRESDGMPFVIYHGTLTGGFEEFTDSDRGVTIGTFGSTDKKTAAGYSGGYSDDVTPVFKTDISEIDRDRLWRWYGNEEIGWEHGLRTNAEKSAKEAGVTSPIRTRYELTDTGFTSESPEVILEKYNSTIDGRNVGDRGVYPLFFKIEKALVVDAKSKHWDDLGHELGNSTREVEEAARKAGYDGVIFKNVRDNGFADVTMDPADVYVVFDPKNIKSVHNAGTFDSSKNILKSMRPKDGDGDGKIDDGKPSERPVARRQTAEDLQRTMGTKKYWSAVLAINLWVSGSDESKVGEFTADELAEVSLIDDARIPDVDRNELLSAIQEGRRPISLSEYNRLFEASGVSVEELIDANLKNRNEELEFMQAAKDRRMADRSWVPEDKYPMERFERFESESDEVYEARKKYWLGQSKFRSVVIESLAKSNLSPEVKAEYANNLLAVTNRLSRESISMVVDNVRDIQWFGNAKDLTRELQKKYGESGTKTIGGCWVSTSDSPDGKLFLNGGADLSAQGIYAHELGHVVDWIPGKEHGNGLFTRGIAISSTKEWMDAFQAEIDNESVPLSEYARTSPSEGLAEFARMLWGGNHPIRFVREQYPRCFEVFENHGLMSKRMKPGTLAKAVMPRKQDLDELFSEPFIRDGVHGDYLIDYRSNEIYKAFNPQQPRDDRGRWVSVGAIRTAANDPSYADRLRAIVNDPEQRRLLDRRIAESVTLTGVKEPKPEPPASDEVPAYLLTFEDYMARELPKEIKKLEDATAKELAYWNEMKLKHEANELTEADVKKIKQYTSFGADPVERAEKINEQIKYVAGWKYANRIKLLKSSRSANFESAKYNEHKEAVRKAIEAGIEVPMNVIAAYSGAPWVPSFTAKELAIQRSVHAANLDFTRIGDQLGSLKPLYESGMKQADSIRQEVIRLGDSLPSRSESLLKEMKQLKADGIKAFEESQAAESPQEKQEKRLAYQQFVGQYEAAQANYQNVSELIAIEVKALVKANGPTAKIEVAYDSSVPSELRERWQKPLEFLNGLLSADLHPNTVFQVDLINAEEESRAYFLAGPVGTGLIKLHRQSTVSTFAHEAGHGVELNAELVDVAKAFLYEKSGGNPAKHLGDNFDPDEVYVPDHLVNDYAGKWYTNSTEVISTGIEELYRDPVEFARKSPEHFNFTVAVVKGWVGSRALTRTPSSLTKSGFDPMQPRDDDGRWVRREVIAAAAQDVEVADSLRSTVTDPEQRKRLDLAIESAKQSATEDFDTRLRRQKAIKAKVKAIVEESPDSEAEVILGDGVERMLDRLDWTPQDLASIVGAPDDSSVHAEITNGALEIHVYHPDIESMVRFVYTKSGRGITSVRPSEKLYIENDVLKIVGANGQSERTAPKGFGTSIFASQVGNCVRRGNIEYITCLAGRNDEEGLVGYSVWPKLGYTGSITNLKASFADKVRMRFPEAKTVLDVNSTQEGRQWWAENGSSFEAVFELDEESPSMKTLAAYQLAKEQVKNG